MSRIQNVVGVVAFLLCYTSSVTSAAPEAQATVSICGLNAGNDCSSNCTKYKIGSDQCLTYWAGHFSDGTAMFKCLSPRPFGSVSGVVFDFPECSTRAGPTPFVDQAMGQCSYGNYYNAVNHTNGTVTIQAWACNYTCKGQRVESPFSPPPADLDCRLMAEGPLNECIRPPKGVYGDSTMLFSRANFRPSTSVLEMRMATRKNLSCSTPVCTNCSVLSFESPVVIAEGTCLVNAYPATGHVSHFSLGCETSHQVLASLPSLSEAPREHVEAFSTFLKNRMPSSRGGGASSGKRFL